VTGAVCVRFLKPRRTAPHFQPSTNAGIRPRARPLVSAPTGVYLEAMSERTPPTAREPVFNLPPVIIASVALLGVIHAIRVWLLTPDQEGWVIAAFSFVPVRITFPAAYDFDWPGGLAGDIWTFFSYAFLHADWMHFGINALWLAAFGTPLARRFGPQRFVAFSLLGAAGGAAAHLALDPYSVAPLVGASAAIAAQMAAAARFAFSPGGRLGGGGAFSADADHRPALTIPEMIRNSRVVMFLGVWFVFNLLFGLLFTPPGIQSSQIAWDAHLGGFIVGLLFFPIFDPVARRVA